MATRSTTRITKRIVDDLQAGQDVWDAAIKGFGVRCQGQSKSYVLKTSIKGRPKWITIGRHGSPWTPEMARSEALKLLGQIVQGEDPTANRGDSSTTIRELCSRYLEDHAIPHKKASTVRLDRRAIENHVVPLIGSKIVTELRTNEVEKFKQFVNSGKTAPKDPKKKQQDQGGGRVVTGGPHVANHCLKLLSKMMTLAELWELRPKGSNPVKGVKHYKAIPKERFLTTTELQNLGAVLDRSEAEETESIWVVATIRLLILTGARVSEILTLKWDYVQIAQRQLRLPDSKTGPKSISLPKEAVELLKSLPRFEDNPYVIKGRRPGAHLVDIFIPWSRIRAAAGLSDVRIHDLRHSFASLAIQNGVSLSVIGKLLGHTRSETTRRYAHFETAYLAQESEKIGRLLTATMASAAPQPETHGSTQKPDTSADDAG